MKFNGSYYLGLGWLLTQTVSAEVIPYVPVLPVPRPVLAEIEKSTLTRPRVGVRLVSARERGIRPVLPALASDGYLYFARKSGTADRRRGCLGDRLYRYPVTATVTERTIEELSLRRIGEGTAPVWEAVENLCLQQVVSHGRFVFVRHLVPGNGRDESRFERLGEVARMREGRRETFPVLVSPERDRTRSWLDSTSWAFQTDHYQDTGNGPLRPLTVLGFGVVPSQRIDTLVRTPASENHPAVLSVSLAAEDQNARPRLRRLPENVERDLATKTPLTGYFASSHWLYLTFNGASRNAMGGFYLIDLDAEDQNGRLPVVARYGLDEPLRETRAREMYEARHWAARIVDHASATAYGFLVADTTEVVAGERALLYYFSPERTEERSTQFVPVQGLQTRQLRDLSGLHYYRGGFIAAFEGSGVIAYFGRTNVFGEERYPSRRPDLEDLSDTERRRLLEEIDP